MVCVHEFHQKNKPQIIIFKVMVHWIWHCQKLEFTFTRVADAWSIILYCVLGACELHPLNATCKWRNIRRFARCARLPISTLYAHRPSKSPQQFLFTRLRDYCLKCILSFVEMVSALMLNIWISKISFRLWQLYHLHAICTKAHLRNSPSRICLMS